jgi:hypothetical protein
MGYVPGYYIAQGRLLWTGEFRGGPVMTESEHRAKRFMLRDMAEDAMADLNEFYPGLALRMVHVPRAERA